MLCDVWIQGAQIVFFVPNEGRKLAGRYRSLPPWGASAHSSTGSFEFGDTLQRCNHWKEVEALWDIEQNAIVPGYPELVLKYLRRLEVPPENHFLTRILKALRLQIPHAQPRHVVTSIHACAKMNYTDVKLVNEILRDYYLSGLHLRLAHSYIPVLCSSLGLLEGSTARGSIPSCRPLLADLADQIVWSLDNRSFSEWEISNIVHGLGRLQFRDEKIMQALARLISSEGGLDRFTHHGLLVLFYGLGQLSFDDMDALSNVINALSSLEISDHFDEVGIATFLFTLAGLKDKPKELVKSLAHEAVKPRRLVKYDARTIGTLCYSIKKLECSEDSVLKPLSEELCRPHRLEEFSNESLYNTVCGFSHLGCTNKQFWARAAGVVLGGQGAARFSLSGISGLLCGFSSAGVQHDLLYDALSREATGSKRLRQSKEFHLVNLLFSFSLLKNLDPNCVMPLLDEIVERVRGFTNCSIQSVLVSMNKLKSGHQQHVLAIGKEAANPQRLPTASKEYISQVTYCLGSLQMPSLGNESVDNLAGEILKGDRIESFDFRDLSSIVYGLGEMRCRQNVLTGVVSEIAKRDLKDCSLVYLANALYGLGRLSCSVNPQIMAIVEEALKPERICNLDVSLASTLVLGLAQLKEWEAQKESIQPLLDVIKPGVGSLSETDISKLLFSMSCLQNPDPRLILFLLEQAVSSDRLSKFDERSLSTILYSLGRLQIKDSVVWERICNEACQEERLVKFSAEGLSNMLRGITQATNQPKEFIEPILKHLTLASRLHLADEHTLVVSLESIARMQVRYERPVENLLTELQQPPREQHLSVSDHIRIARSVSKIGFINDKTSLAVMTLLDGITVPTFLRFPARLFDEFVGFVHELPNPSTKLSITLRHVVTMRGHQLRRTTLQHVDDMWTLVKTHQQGTVQTRG